MCELTITLRLGPRQLLTLATLGPPRVEALSVVVTLRTHVIFVRLTVAGAVHPWARPKPTARTTNCTNRRNICVWRGLIAKNHTCVHVGVRPRRWQAHRRELGRHDRPGRPVSQCGLQVREVDGRPWSRTTSPRPRPCSRRRTGARCRLRPLLLLRTIVWRGALDRCNWFWPSVSGPQRLASACSVEKANSEEDQEAEEEEGRRPGHRPWCQGPRWRPGGPVVSLAWTDISFGVPMVGGGPVVGSFAAGAPSLAWAAGATCGSTLPPPLATCGSALPLPLATPGVSPEGPAAAAELSCAAASSASTNCLST